MGYQSWWSWSGSNRRPPECKSGALPAELQPLVRNTIEADWTHGPGDQPLTHIYFRTPSRESERFSHPCHSLLGRSLQPGAKWSGTPVAVYLSATPPTFS